MGADRRQWQSVAWFRPGDIGSHAAFALSAHRDRRDRADAWLVRGYNDDTWTKRSWEFPDLPSALRKIAQLVKRAQAKVPLASLRARGITG